MSTNTNTYKIQVTADALASARKNKAQAQALALALQGFIDAPGTDAQKERRASAASRIGKDVLKRKNALAARTPGELRTYVEAMRQKSQAQIAQLVAGTWLLDHCAKEAVRVTLAQTVELCDMFVQEYNESKDQLKTQANKAA